MQRQLFILLAGASFTLSATPRCPKETQARHAMYKQLGKAVATTAGVTATAVLTYWALATQQIQK